MKKSCTIYSLFALVVFYQANTVCFANNKEIVLKQLSVEQGLPGDNVRSMLQDSYGYIWFGIESAGLCKYDGDRFYVHGPKDSDTNSISNSFINDIVEDANGDLWLATENGLNIYDRKKGIFVKYFYPDIPHNRILTIYMDNNKAIWIGTFNGMMKFNPVKGIQDKADGVFGYPDKKIKYQVDKNCIVEDLEDKRIYCILQDDGESYWFGTLNGLYHIDFSKNKTRHWGNIPIEEGNITASAVNDFSKLTNGYYLIGTDYGVSLLNIYTNTFTTLTFEQSGIFQDARVGIISVFFDSKGLLWIATNSNGLVTGPVSNLPKDLHLKIDPPHLVEGLSSSHIRDIYEDQTGQIWILTKYAGVFKYDTRSQLFPYYVINEQDNNFILTACEKRNGNIIIGSKFGGLFEFDRQKNQFHQKKIFIDDVFLRRIECLYIDNNQDIWVGIKKGVLRLDSLKNIKNFYQVDKPWDFVLDKSGIFWLASEQGVMVFNFKTNQFERFNCPNENSFFTNSDIIVRTLFEDSKGNIWFATDSKGVFRYNCKTNSMANFMNDIGKKESLSGNTIRSLFEDSRGAVWVGTKSAGLNKLTNDSSGFQHYTKTEGLPSNTVFGIVEDDSGNLWLTTNNGVSKFNPKNKKFTNFNKSHGLQGNVFEARPTIKLKNGDIMFGGNNGFNIFSPNKVDIDTFNPPLVITRINANGKIIEKDIFESEKVTIPYKHSKLISIEFASLDFRDPAALKYAYRLEDTDPDWVFSGKRNSVTYTGLSHGKYNFSFKATNADGIWTKQDLTVVLAIQTPFWLQWWAYVFYAILIITLFIGIYHTATIRANYNHKLQTKELELKKNEELNQLKLRFFTNISHELRTPLSLIIAPLQKLLKSEELSEEIKQKIKLVERSTKRLMKLADQLLYFRKAQQANLRLEISQHDIVQFIGNIIPQFHDLADSYGLQLEFVCDYDKLLLWIDPDKVEKIVSNLLSNAFKFTPKYGKINVHIHKPEGKTKNRKRFLAFPNFDKSQYLKITVSDSGIGMTDKQLANIFQRFYQAEPFDTGVGIGLELVKQLVDIHKAKIEVDSTPGHGTCFSLYLPQNKYLYRNEVFADRKLENEGYKSNIEPLVLYPREKEEEIKLPQFEGEKNGKPSILIVEDNSDLMLYLKQVFKKDYNIYLANNGLEATEIIKENLPDIIITDLMMPKMNGIEFCEKVKSDIKTSHIPVIMLTAKNQPEDHIEGLRTGADDYITKPFVEEILHARIKNLILSRQKLRERFANSIYVDPSEITTNKTDEKFMANLLKIIDDDISNPDLSINDISNLLAMDRTNLFKKIKSLFGKSPSQFIREYRIKKAAKLMLSEKYNINEISYMVGFTSPAYFSKLFRESMSKTPSEFIAENGLNTTLKKNG